MSLLALKETQTPAYPQDTTRELLERYERAARCGNEGLWEWDLRTGRAWCSPALKQMLGYSPAEQDDPTILGLFNDFLEHVHVEHRNPLLFQMRYHLEQHEAFEMECQLLTRSGELRWFHLRGSAQRDVSGHPSLLSGSMRDTTECKRHEDQARHAEEFQRLTLDALHVAVGVLNSRGEIREINRFWREFPLDKGLIGARYGLGADYPELCEKTAQLCVEGPEVAAGIRAVLEGRLPAFALTYSVVVPEGKRHYELRALPFADEPGAERSKRGAFIIHMDVSATREAYAALETSRDFYESILNAIPIQISYIDKDQRILYMNQAYERWFRFPLTAWQGRNVTEATAPMRYKETAQRVEDVLAGQSVEFDQRVQRADGAMRDLVVTYVPHRDADNQVVGFISVVRDVTDQKRLHTSLHQAQKMEALGQLTGGIAHDFNNLLSAIIGNLQLLERPLRGHKRLLKYVQTPLHASLRGAELTRRLLTFARRTPLEPQVLDVNALVEEMRELLGHALGREIEICCALTPEPWPVRADPGQLESCLLNLAINARDAMPAGGRLTLATRNVSADAHGAAGDSRLAPGDYLVLSVSDTGCGMAPEVTKRAFEPFFTTKEVGKGTGLGLSMVYGFMEQSRGVVALRSEVGVGTTVHLYFPRANGHAEKTPSVAPYNVPREPHGNEAILVVEGDHDVRATAVGALRAFGYTVLEAATATEALRTLQGAARFDLLFTDISLPGGIHGPSLATRARALQPGLRILFTTGFSESIALHRGLLDGSLALIPKPYSITDLAGRVRATLDGE